MSQKILIVFSLVLIAIVFQNCGGQPPSSIEKLASNTDVGNEPVPTPPQPTPDPTPLPTPVLATPTPPPPSTPTPAPTLDQVIKKEVSDALAAQYKKLAEGFVVSRAQVIDLRELEAYEKADQQLRDLYAKARKGGIDASEAAAIRALLKSNNAKIDVYARRLSDYARLLKAANERIALGRYFRQLTDKELAALDKMVGSFKKVLIAVAKDGKLEAAEGVRLEKALKALDAKISAFRTNDQGVPQPADRLADAVHTKMLALAYKTMKCYMGGTIASRRFQTFAQAERDILDLVFEQKKIGPLTKAVYDQVLARIEALDKAVAADCAN